MVDFPDPDDSTEFDLDRGSDGMPDRTRRAFQSHYDVHLSDSDRVQQALTEIESVYQRCERPVISVSGGKDSMCLLTLGATADVDLRAAHWDYGPDFLPRSIETEIVENVRSYVPDRRCYVGNELMPVFKPYTDAGAFKRQLDTDTRLPSANSVRDEPGMKGVSRLAPRLRRTIDRGIFDRQLLGTRRRESGSRDRYIDGLYGTSLGQPAAFPLRDWTARDVWGVLVDRGVPYPTHYDKQAHTIGDGDPEHYEDVRLGGLFRWTGSSADGIAHWRERTIEAREWERDIHREQRGRE